MLGGNSRQWQQYEASQAAAAAKEASAQAKEQEKAAAAAAKAAADEQAKARYVQILGRGQSPDKDMISGAYVPKIDPSTGQPEVRKYSAEVAGPNGKPLAKITGDAQQGMQIERPKPDAISRNSLDPADFRLYRGEQIIEPEAALRDSDPLMQQHGAAAMRDREAAKLTQQLDDIRSSLDGIEAVSRTEETEARQTLESLAAYPDDTEAGAKRKADAESVLARVEQRKSAQNEIKRVGQQRDILRRTPLDQLSQRFLNATAGRAESDYRAVQAADTAALDAEFKARDSKLEDLNARAAAWKAKNEAGIPGGDYEQHAREGAAIEDEIAALTAYSTDLEKRFAQVRKAEDALKAEAAKRGETLEEAKKRVAQAQKAVETLPSTLFGGTGEKPAAPTESAKPAPAPAAKSKDVSPAKDTRGSYKLSLADMTGGKDVWLPAGLDATVGANLEDQGGGVRSVTDVTALKGDVPVPIEVARRFGEKELGRVETLVKDFQDSQQKALDTALQAAKINTQSIFDSETPTGQNTVASLLIQPGKSLWSNIGDAIRYTGAKSASMAGKIDDTGRAIIGKALEVSLEENKERLGAIGAQLPALRQAAFRGIVPMNRVVEAYKAVGVDVKDIPTAEEYAGQEIAKGGVDYSMESQTLYAQEERMKRLEEYGRLYGDQPFFDEDAYSALFAQQADRVKGEQNRLLPVGEKARIMWNNAWDRYKEGMHIIRTAYNVATNDAVDAKEALQAAQKWREVAATRGVVGGSERDSYFGVKGANTVVSMLPDIFETVATTTAAASFGSLAGPGGTVSGTVTGIFGKSALKKLVAKQAAVLIGKGATKEAATATVLKQISAGLAKEAAQAGGEKLIQRALKAEVAGMFASAGAFASSLRGNGAEMLSATLGQMTPDELAADPDKARRAVMISAMLSAPAAALDALDGVESGVFRRMFGKSPAALRGGFAAAAGNWAKKLGMSALKEGGTGFVQGLLGIVNQRMHEGQKPFSELTSEEITELADNTIGEAFGGFAFETAGGVANLRKAGTMVKGWKAADAAESATKATERMLSPKGLATLTGDASGWGRIVAGGMGGDALGKVAAELRSRADEAANAGDTKKLTEINQQIARVQRVRAAAIEQDAAVVREMQQQAEGVSPEKALQVQTLARVMHADDPAAMTEAELASVGFARKDGQIVPMDGATPMMELLPGSGRWLVPDAVRAAVTAEVPAFGKMQTPPEAVLRQLDAEAAKAVTQPVTPVTAVKPGKTAADMPQFAVTVEGLADPVVVRAKDAQAAEAAVKQKHKGKKVTGAAPFDIVDEATPAEETSPAENDAINKIKALAGNAWDAQGIGDIMNQPQYSAPAIPGLLDARMDAQTLGGRVNLVFEGRAAAEAFMSRIPQGLTYGINDAGGISVVNVRDVGGGTTLTEQALKLSPIPTASPAPAPASPIEEALKSFGEGALTATAARVREGKDMTVRRADAIAALRVSPVHTIEDNADGSVRITGVLDPVTKQWVGKAPSPASPSPASPQVAPAPAPAPTTRQQQREAAKAIRAEKDRLEQEFLDKWGLPPLEGDSTYEQWTAERVALNEKIKRLSEPAPKPEAAAAPAAAPTPAKSSTPAPGPAPAPAPTAKASESVAAWEESARSQVGGIDGSERAQFESTLAAVSKFLPELGPQFAGVQWSMEADNSGGFSLNPETGVLHISVPKLANTLKKTKSRDKWILAGLMEEIIHRITLRMEESGDLDASGIVARVKKENPKVWAAFKKVYPRARKEHEPHEFMRMIVQGRIRVGAAGVAVDRETTEEQFSDDVLGAIRQYLAKLVSAVRALAKAFDPGTAEALHEAAEAIIAVMKANWSTGKTSPAAETGPPASAGGDTVDAPANEAATSPANDKPQPTDAQKAAGNYAKGHVRFGGMDISIENPAGSERTGTDKGGKAWSITMLDHYGYIRGTEGKDGDHLDIFINPGTPLDYNGPVWVVNQRKADYTFDEHKAVTGIETVSTDSGMPSYARNYTAEFMAKQNAAFQASERMGKNVFPQMVKFDTMADFRAWVESADLTKPATLPEKPKAEESVSPETPDQAPATEPAPVSSLAEEAKRFAGELSKKAPNLIERLMDMHADGKTAQEIASALGIEVSDVRKLRVGLGLPSHGRGFVGDDDPMLKERFDEWAAKRKAQNTTPDTVDAPANEAATSPANDKPQPTEAQKEAVSPETPAPQSEELDSAPESTMPTMVDHGPKATVFAAAIEGTAKSELMPMAKAYIEEAGGTPEALAQLLVSEGMATEALAKKAWSVMLVFMPERGATQPDWSALFAASIQPQEPAPPPPAPAPAPAPAPEPSGDTVTNLAQAVRDAILAGPVNRRELAKLAAGVDPSDSLAMKQIDEAAELGIYLAARSIIERGMSQEDTFDALVELYGNQPNLTAKDSTSKVNQAYSTPTPLSYAAGMAADLANATFAWDGTAGNGLLTIAADPSRVIVNEINPDRLANLERIGFARITQEDATTISAPEGVDRQALNPPFGQILSGGEPKTWPIYTRADGVVVMTKAIDHAIAMKSLESLPEDGRAVLILGGKKGTDAERMAGYKTFDSQLPFWNRLYDQFNVVQHVTVDGDLYKKQGAGWPVDVIVIEGRGKSALPKPYTQAPAILDSWGAVKSTILLGNEPTRSTNEGGKPPAKTAVGNGPKRPRKLSAGKSGLGGVGGTGGQGAVGQNDVQTPGDSGALGTSGRDGERGGVSGDNPEPPAAGLNTAEALNVLRDIFGTKGNRTIGTADLADGFTERVPANLEEALLFNAGRLVAAGVNAPEKLAGLLKQEGLTRYSQSIWRALLLSLPDDSPESPDWKGYYSPEQEVDDENPYQVKYTPRSKAPLLNETLTPANLSAETSEAMDALEARRGSIDDFVLRELRWFNGDRDLLFSVLDGAQIDAVALAIDNIMRGTALVTGDQTGMGKGRVAAAIMGWARQNGYTPVFVTAADNLYQAMMEDIQDIKADFLLPWLTNTAAKVADRSENIIYRGSNAEGMKRELRHIIDTGSLPNSKNTLFTTYAQVASDVLSGFSETKRNAVARKRQRIPRPDGLKTQALRALAPNAVFVLDEAHKAAGDGDTNYRFMQLLLGMDISNRTLEDRQPKGAYYSSATFAKRPDNMPVFCRTELGGAIDPPTKLADVFTVGGIPLQQAANTMLAKAGGYIRREMSFAGISFTDIVLGDAPTKERPYPEQYRKSDAFTSPMRAILDYADNMFQLVDELNVELMAQGVMIDGERVADQLESTNFNSQVHNIVNQYLFAIKARDVARRAVDELKAGRKPVITVENTMEGPITEVISMGEVTNFKGLLARYLENTHMVTKKTAGTDEKVKVRINIQQHIRSENPRIRAIAARLMASYRMVQEHIEAADVEDIHISPIDVIIDEIRKSGYNADEITGRSTGVRTDGKVYKRPSKASTAAYKNEILAAFNDNGKPGMSATSVDALIVNVSGATGLSMHSSPKYFDKRPRVMLVAQPNADISIMMQMYGRIFRKGQLHLPEYYHVMSYIAAERRVFSNLKRKLRGLKANTTANQEGVEKTDAKDLNNDYGDLATWRVLDRNEDIADKLRHLDMPRSDDPDNDSSIITGGAFYARASGEVNMMPARLQQRFYEEIGREYDEIIAAEDALGTNRLKVSTADFKAEVISSTTLVEASGDGIFKGAAVVEKVSASTGRKPYSIEEVTAEADKNSASFQQRRQQWREAATKESERIISERKTERGHLEGWSDTEQRLRNKAIRAMAQIENMFDFAGSGIMTAVDGNTVYGGVVDFAIDLDNPLVPSRQKAVSWVNNSQRVMALPASKLQGDKVSRVSLTTLRSQYTAGISVRQVRHIVTGNIIAGLGTVINQGVEGRIITFTMADGSFRTGVLLPADYNMDQSMRPITNASQLIDAVRQGFTVNSSGGVTITASGPASLQVFAPANRATGGKYWREDAWNRIFDGGVMTQSTNSMRGVTRMTNAESIIEFMKGLGHNAWVTIPTTTGRGSRISSFDPGGYASPEFYSTLERVIEAKMPARAPGKMVEGIVSNPQTGVKAEELKWTGLVPWLESQSGPVEKSAVLEYLRGEGAVRFEEVQYGAIEEPQKALQALIDEYTEQLDQLGYEVIWQHEVIWQDSGETNSRELIGIEMMSSGRRYTEMDSWGDAEAESILARLSSAHGQLNGHMFLFGDPTPLTTGPAPEYSQYQLPGGKNYREVVLAMPVDTNAAQESKSRRVKQLIERRDAIEAMPRGEERGRQLRNVNMQIDVAMKAPVENASSYTSSHFPNVPNYVAHMRLNERKDAEGKAGLFIEELQSDLHQAGREKGYRIQEELDRLKSEFDIAEKRFSDALKEWSLMPAETPSVLYERSEDNNPITAWSWLEKNKQDKWIKKWERQWQSKEERESAVTRIRDLRLTVGDLMGRKKEAERNYRNAQEKSIPDAPFRTTWPLALFKRALRDAVAAGKQWIGWTDGAEQAGRYENDMRAKIDQITWQTTGGKKSVKAMKNGNIFFGGNVDTEGNIRGSGTEADGKPVGDVFGKSMAEKIAAADKGVLEGAGLTIGGEGMKGFYDNILPKEVGKYVKQWGAGVVKGKILADATPIWRVDITPEMAAGVRRGQPIFTLDPDAFEDAAAEVIEAADELMAAAAAGKPVGDPSRAMSMITEAMQAADTLYVETIPQATRDEWDREGQALLQERGSEPVRALIMRKAYSNEILTAAETAAAKILLVQAMGNMRTPEEKLRNLEYAIAYRHTGYNAAASLGSRVDPLMTPAQRIQKWLTGILLAPEEKSARKAAEKRREATATDDTAEASRLRIEALQLELEGAKAAMAKLEADLKKSGFTLHEWLNTAVVIERDTPAWKRLTGMMDDWMKSALQKMQGGHIPFKQIAREVGKLESDVRRVRAQFEKQFRAFVEANWKAGMTGDDLLKLAQPAAAKKIATADVGGGDAKEQAIQDALMKMGLVDAEKQGKAKVKRKRSGKPSKLDPDAIVERMLRAWRAGGGSKEPSKIVQATREYAKAKDATDEARDALRGKLEDFGVAEDLAEELAGIAQDRVKAAILGDMTETIVFMDFDDTEMVIAAAKQDSARRADGLDMLREYYYFSLLSGPTTQVANMANYPAHLLLNNGLTRTVAALLGSTIGAGSNGVHTPKLAELAGMWSGFGPGFVDGLRLAVKSWRTGVDFTGIDKLGFDSTNGRAPKNAAEMARKMGVEIPAPAIPGVAGKVVRIPMAIMQFMDVLGKTIVAHMEANAFAHRIAKAEQKGMKFASPAARKADYMARKEEALERGGRAWKEAIAESMEAGFQTPLDAGRAPKNAVDKFERRIAGVIDKIDSLFRREGSTHRGFIVDAAMTLAKLILFPFLKTPYNIIRVGLRKTPLGLPAFVFRAFEGGLMKLMKNKEFGETYGQFFNHMAEQVLAWGAFMLLGAITEGDDDDDKKTLLLVGGPLPGRYDREENAARLLQYGENFVLRLGDRETGYNIPFSRYEPLATVLGTTIDTLRALRKMDSDVTASERANRVLAGLMSQAENKTFLKGLSDLMNAMRDVAGGTGEKTKAYGLNILASVVPNIIKAPMRQQDENQREWKTADPRYRFVPSADFAESKINLAGDAVKKDANTVTRTFFPVAADTSKALPPHLQAVNTYNAGRSSRPFDDGGTWAPAQPSLRLENHPGLPKGDVIELGPKAYRLLSELTAKRMAEIANITPAEAKKPTKDTIERIRKAAAQASAYARDILRRMPPGKLREGM